MADVFSKEFRSQIMGRIGGKNTRPEVVVRKLLHGLGFRFRLHKKDLPGKPDIVLARWKSVVFVHGCFWHSHQGCKRSALPKTNFSFWEDKINKNVARDARNLEELESMGYRCLVIWECETKDLDLLTLKINLFFGAGA